MFKTKAHRTLTSLILGMACLSAPGVSNAASAVKLSGTISGVVTNSTGIPQMGAVVQLFNRQDHPYGKALTDEHGAFKFLALFPDLYSIRVSLASFVPAFKKDILVQPGMRSALNVSLNTLFSSIQLSYPPIENGSFMTDDWKWVLRSASATRPVLRFMDAPPAGDSERLEHAAMFSDTRGIVRVSAGEGGTSTGAANEADLGTAFALATSLYGNNMLQVSGNLGYGAQTGVPAAAFRTSFSRSVAGGSPEISLTMRQLFLPQRLGSALVGSDSAVPMLRSVSAGFDDHTQVASNLTLQYGFTLESVQFIDRLNTFSPYARLSYSLGEGEELDFAYTSGQARPDLAGAGSEEAEFQRDLTTLGAFPRLSLSGSRPRIQRGEEYELSYARKVGSRTYTLSAYREAVTDAALMLVGPAGFGGNDILPDLFSGNSVFNAGDFHSSGYTAAVTQHWGEQVSATLMYGLTGGLTAGNGEITSDNPDELRSMIRAGRRHTATARIKATSPWTGTHLIASYQWSADHRWAMPGNQYSTQDFQPLPGLNLSFRQPIPGFTTHIEATAELRNLLAEGYMPMGMVGGQRVMLVQTPRSFRGGLSITF